jgi:hypothetical protein
MTKAGLRKRWSDPAFLGSLPIPLDRPPKSEELRALDLRGIPKLFNDEPLGHFKIQSVHAESIDVSFGDGALWVNESEVRKLTATQFKFDRASWFHKSVFEECDFTDARFRLNMIDVRFVNCCLNGSTFAGGHNEYGLKRCTFEKCTFVGAVWKNPYIFATTFTACDLTNVEFHNALIAGFKHQDCIGVDKIEFVQCEVRSIIDLRTGERRTSGSS